MTGLEVGQTYYYRVLATNGTGTTTDPTIEHFTTQGKPIATTGEAQNMTQTTATFSGTVDPVGAETTYYFAYIDQAGYEKALAGDAEEKANPYAEGETRPRSARARAMNRRRSARSRPPGCCRARLTTTR